MTLQFEAATGALLARGCGTSVSLMAECCSFAAGQNGCGDCADPLTVTFDIEGAPDAVNTSYDVDQFTAISCDWRKPTFYVVEGAANYRMYIQVGFEEDVPWPIRGPGCTWFVVIGWNDLNDPEFSEHVCTWYRYRGGPCDVAGAYVQSGGNDPPFFDVGSCVVS
jgi:hypothetical protein